MTLSSADLQVIIKAVDEASSTFAKVRQNAEEHSKGISSAFGGISGSIKGVMGDLALFDLAMRGLDKLTEPIKAITDALQEHQKVQAQTNAVLKSTGDASGVTAQQMGALAQSLSDVTGKDRDVIQSAQNILATFTNIGGNIMPQTTKAVLDFSQAMGIDANQAALQIGKALNDPIKGMTTLQREGVSFTQSQKDLVKQLVDTGQGAKAQAMILNELQKEFGGSAEAAGKTFGGQLDILKNKIKDSIVDGLQPMLANATAFATTILEKAVPAVEAWINTDLKPWLHDVEDWLEGHIVPALSDLWDWITNKVVPALQNFWQNDVVPKAQEFARVWTDQVQPALQNLANNVLPPVKQAIEGVIQFISDHKEILAALAIGLGIAAAAFVVVTVASTAFGAVMAVITSPVTLVVAAIALVALGIIELIKHWDDITAKVPILGQAWDGIQAKFHEFVAWLTGSFLPNLEELWNNIKQDTADLEQWIKDHWQAISDTFGVILGIILGVVQTTWNEIKAHIQTTMDLIRNIIAVVMAVLHGDWGKAWEAIKTLALSLVTDIKNEIGAILGLVPNVVSGIWTMVGEDAARLWNNIVKTVQDGVNAVLSAVGSMVNAIGDGMAKVAAINLNIPGIGNVGFGGLGGIASSLQNFKPSVDLSGAQVSFSGGGSKHMPYDDASNYGPQEPTGGTNTASGPSASSTDTGGAGSGGGGGVPDMSGGGANNFNQGGGGGKGGKGGKGGGGPNDTQSATQQVGDLTKALKDLQEVEKQVNDLQTDMGKSQHLWSAQEIADLKTQTDGLKGLALTALAKTQQDAQAVQADANAIQGLTGKAQQAAQQRLGYDQAVFNEDKATSDAAYQAWKDSFDKTDAAQKAMLQSQRTEDGNARSAHRQLVTDDADYQKIQNAVKEHDYHDTTQAMLADDTAHFNTAKAQSLGLFTQVHAADQQVLQDTQDIATARAAGDQTAYDAAKTRYDQDKATADDLHNQMTDAMADESDYATMVKSDNDDFLKQAGDLHQARQDAITLMQQQYTTEKELSNTDLNDFIASEQTKLAEKKLSFTAGEQFIIAELEADKAKYNAIVQDEAATQALLLKDQEALAQATTDAAKIAAQAKIDSDQAIIASDNIKMQKLMDNIKALEKQLDDAVQAQLKAIQTVSGGGGGGGTVTGGGYVSGGGALGNVLNPYDYLRPVGVVYGTPTSTGVSGGPRATGVNITVHVNQQGSQFGSSPQQVQQAVTTGVSNALKQQLGTGAVFAGVGG